MEEPGRLQCMGSHRVGHDGSDLAAAVGAILIFYFAVQGIISYPLIPCSHLTIKLEKACGQDIRRTSQRAFCKQLFFKFGSPVDIQILFNSVNRRKLFKS